jgi:RimJ/RimL family protein N-acetyltransferase
LATEDGHRSYLIYDQALLIGHAALRKTKVFGSYNVSFMYLAPKYRGQGLGGQVLQFLIQVAKREIEARRLNLVVREYNPRAFKCYQKAGFAECGREGTAIQMTMALA